MGRRSRTKADRRAHRECAAQALRLAASEAPADQALRRLAKQRDATQAAMETEIRRLVEAGHTWTMVGAALGMSRQGARQRYQRVMGAR